ncbi:urea amidolyase related protein [Candidatus Vecturithrix granuli]|uniref:Urea amidolyase related protein n=1 Tax=Vecturithrix granuli TaxID=1499967 RepID=A0A081BVI5_VECG1|nr:urea amidolyase related protein [Candidatus Vecturithrix granuli]
MGIIQIKQAGMLTTVQDLGRWGFGRFGMPVAGVMDEYAARVANILLENDENTSVLEITLMGPTLVFDAETAFVIGGGDLQPRLNNAPIALWTIQYAHEGDTLSFAGLKSGCRAYLAVTGGFQVEAVMGSASTYLRGKLGGYDGRALKAGDVLTTSQAVSQKILPGLALPLEYLPQEREAIRVILGPQDDAFTQKGIDTFLSATYTVTNEADRMGYRLDGPKIEHKSGADIISDGIASGAIQVPAHGTPIIMLADRQTTGGYTKIANVISVDLPCVAQKKPGDAIRFEQVTVQEAQRLYREREQRLEQLQQFVRQHAEQSLQRISHYIVTINGQQHHVCVEEVV